MNKVRHQSLQHNPVRIIMISLRALGITETIKGILVHFLKLKILRYRPDRDSAFDRRFGTDTAHVVARESLGIADASVRQTAVPYVAAPVQFQRYVLRRLPIDCRDYDFVDIGCGKGRVLMLASELSFRTVTGIEISVQLCQAARRNLQAFPSCRQKCAALDVQCMDARDFRMQNANAVFHFYHPVDDMDVLSTILGNIKDAVKDGSHDVWIIYVWKSVKQLLPLFEKLGFEFIEYQRTVNARYQYAVFHLKKVSQAS